MAINQNHLFEELDGVKCGIAEKNASAERAAFLKKLLEYNQYTVVIAKSPPPKAAAKPVAAAPSAAASTPVPPPAPSAEETPPQPETFTVGVTDVTFNPINAIFGRLLRTEDGRVVTLAYWQQKESIANDEVPYFQAIKSSPGK